MPQTCPPGARTSIVGFLYHPTVIQKYLTLSDNDWSGLRPSDTTNLQRTPECTIFALRKCQCTFVVAPRPVPWRVYSRLAQNGSGFYRSRLPDQRLTCHGIPSVNRGTRTENPWVSRPKRNYSPTMIPSSFGPARKVVSPVPPYPHSSTWSYPKSQNLQQPSLFQVEE